MPRKNRQQHQVSRKRRDFTDSDGWTHVVVGGRKLDSWPEFCSHQESPELQALDRDRSIRQIQKDHARCSRIWKESECASQIQTLMQDTILPLTHLTLKRCVCLGLGSLTSSRDSPRYELVALISLLDMLREKHAVTSVIFQDPAFLAVDVEFLTGLGYSVVSSPTAFDSIDHHTFLFAPHLEHHVLSIAVQHVSPALCIANSVVASAIDTDTSATASSPLHGALWEYAETSDTKTLPEFDRDTWCHFTSIYWRRRCTSPGE